MTYQDFADYSNANELTLAIARLRTQERISLDKGDYRAADDAKIALGRAQARLAELYRERGLLDGAVPAGATMTPAERAAKGWESVLANPFLEPPPGPPMREESRKSKPKKATAAPAPRPDDLERTLTYSTKRLAGVIRARKLTKQDEAELACLPTSALVFLPKATQPLCTATDLEALGWSRRLIIELGSPADKMRYRRTQILHRASDDDFQRELARLYQIRLEDAWHERRRREHERDLERLTPWPKRESEAARRWKEENARYQEILNTRKALEAGATPAGKEPDLTVTPIRSIAAQATVKPGRTGDVRVGVCPVCNKGGLPRGWVRHQRCQGMTRSQKTEKASPVPAEAAPAPERSGRTAVPGPDGSAEYRRLVAVVEKKEAAAQGKRAAGSARPVRIPEARRAVLERCEGRCENPGCTGQPDDVTYDGLPLLEVDHVDEIADGGRDHPCAMVALCPNCHAIKTRGRTKVQLTEVLRGVAERAHAVASSKEA
ncbi:HNH endonuclease signature motif containing protein [Kitasatospora sp. NPDC051914]|uniref:HNH endonuclease signature motif containing protein n=1 Tax=Kitasatospora sp. NPDC051914 TaxID=3154945 RepID=UPI0034432E0A